MAPHAALCCAMAPTGSCLSSLSSRAPGRSYPRWEPDAVTPLVRICGGGHGRSRSILRLRTCDPSTVRLTRNSIDDGPTGKGTAFSRAERSIWQPLRHDCKSCPSQTLTLSEFLQALKTHMSCSDELHSETKSRVNSALYPPPRPLSQLHSNISQRRLRRVTACGLASSHGHQSTVRRRMNRSSLAPTVP